MATRPASHVSNPFALAWRTSWHALLAHFSETNSMKEYPPFRQERFITKQTIQVLAQQARFGIRPDRNRLPSNAYRGTQRDCESDEQVARLSAKCSACFGVKIRKRYRNLTGKVGQSMTKAQVYFVMRLWPIMLFLNHPM